MDKTRYRIGMGLPCSRSAQIKHGGRRILPANFVIPDSHPLTSALLLTTIYSPQAGVNATVISDMNQDKYVILVH